MCGWIEVALRLHRRGLTLTAANAADIASVRRRLDGMPLTIELVAARLNALSIRARTLQAKAGEVTFTGNPGFH